MTRIIIGVLAVIAVGVTAAAVYLGVTREAPLQPAHADVAYGEAQRNVLDIYLPEAPAKAAPVVLYIHGGNFHLGDKSWARDIAQPFLAAGFAVAAINYRLSDTDKWPAQLKDVTAAVRFLQARGHEYDLDPGRIALFGLSAGGHLAAFTGAELAEEPETGVKAVIVWFAPTLFTAMDDDMAASGNEPVTDPIALPTSPGSRLIGAAVGDRPDLANAASPVTRIAGLARGAKLPPFLIMHGGKDQLVAPKQSERLKDAIEASPANGGVTYNLLPDDGHGGGGFDDAETFDIMITFLRQAMR